MTHDGGTDAGDAGDAGNDGSTLGGCHSPTDQAELSLHQSVLFTDFETCASLSGTNNVAFAACMATKLVVSSTCGTCYGAYRACGSLHCLSQCATTSITCTACLASNCNPALTACGGKVPPGL
jgi:hypothetical protein